MRLELAVWPDACCSASIVFETLVLPNRPNMLNDFIASTSALLTASSPLLTWTTDLLGGTLLQGLTRLLDLHGPPF